jgi:phosphate-selective porin OprO and OprP
MYRGLVFAVLCLPLVSLAADSSLIETKVDEPLPLEETLSEDEIKTLIDNHLKEKEAAEEDGLTAEEKKKRDSAMAAQWNNGLEFLSADKKYRIHVGGRTQIDSSWYGVPANVNGAINNPYGDGVDFRRGRFRVDGTINEVHEFAAEYDFFNGIRNGNVANTGFNDQTVSAPTDLWWQIKKVPGVGNIRFGNQKEQIGFEHIVSSRFLPLMERSFNQDTFYGNLYNGFQPGITIFDNYGSQQNGVWNVGVFKPTNNVFSSANGDGDYAVSGRLTHLLYYADEGRQLMHVGVSGRQASTVSVPTGPGEGTETFRTRDAVRSGLSANWPVPAGITLFGDDMQWVNGEFVGVQGPITWQSEYLVSGLQDARAAFADPGRTVTYHGGYAQVGWFLTGESDHYNKATGVFERVVPYSNFYSVDRCGGVRGTGAWQVVFRYNHLDLNDEGLNGGILDGYTSGLNWYWNPNMKVQFNYNLTERDVSDVAAFSTGSGNICSYGMRFAMDF